MRELHKEAKHKNIDLMISIHEKLPAVVVGSDNQFKQLVTYFTSNAFKQSTNVRVGVDLVRIKDEGTAVIEFKIQDNGPGLSEEELDVCQSHIDQA